MLFSLNVMDEVEEKFGELEKLAEAIQGKGRIKNVKWILTRLLNEGATEGEEVLTEEEVGKMIHAGNFKALTEAIFHSLAVANSGTDEAAAEDEPGNEAEEPGEDGAGDELGDDGKNGEAGEG